MDFIDQLKALAGKVPALCDMLQTEEATKNALVMPFIRALGYDIFDPFEVVPEFVADVGIKKGEKVDYAIKKGVGVLTNGSSTASSPTSKRRTGWTRSPSWKSTCST